MGQFTISDKLWSCKNQLIFNHQATDLSKLFKFVPIHRCLESQEKHSPESRCPATIHRQEERHRFLWRPTIWLWQQCSTDQKFSDLWNGLKQHCLIKNTIFSCVIELIRLEVHYFMTNTGNEMKFGMSMHTLLSHKMSKFYKNCIKTNESSIFTYTSQKIEYHKATVLLTITCQDDQLTTILAYLQLTDVSFKQKRIFPHRSPLVFQ